MKLYEINEGFEGTQEEIREYAMYGCPDADMQFLF